MNEDKKTIFADLFEWTKEMLANIKAWFSDHYHLLFKSAADNHLRIQNTLKNADGTYQVTVKFASYTDLKKYQKKLRRMTVSLSSAVAMVIVAFIVAPYVMNPSRSSANSFVWSQSNWEGAAAATGTTNKTTWKGYASKDTNITAQAGGVSLKLPDPGTASYNSGANNYNNFSDVAAQPGFYISGGALKLLKPVRAGCGVAGDGIGSGECSNNTCKINECFPDLAAGYHLDSNGTDINTTNNNTLNGVAGIQTLYSGNFPLTPCTSNVGWYLKTSGGSPTPGTCNGAFLGHTTTMQINAQYSAFYDFTAPTNGTFTYSFAVTKGGSNSMTYNMKMDGADIGVCSPAFNSWTTCTGSAAVTAGSHTFSIYNASNMQTYIDTMTLTGPVAFNWDTTTKAPISPSTKTPNTASAKTAGGTYLQPGSAITLGSDWTVSAWVYNNGATGVAMYEHLLGDGTSAAVALFNNGTTVLPGVVNEGDYNTGTGGLALNTWNFITAVGSGGATKFYNNIGAQIGSTVNSQLTGAMTHVGNDSTKTKYVGNIDELLVFNRVLTPAEIAALAVGW